MIQQIRKKNFDRCTHCLCLFPCYHLPVAVRLEDISLNQTKQTTLCVRPPHTCDLSGSNSCRRMPVCRSRHKCRRQTPAQQGSRDWTELTNGRARPNAKTSMRARPNELDLGTRLFDLRFTSSARLGSPVVI